MRGREEYSFWRLAYFFIVEHNYRLTKINDAQTEMWLENPNNKKARMIRMLNYNLDWANWMKQDLQFMAEQSERLRKHISAREMNVLNIYVTSHPPVDDYSQLIENAISTGKGKTHLNTVLMSRENMGQAMLNIGESIGTQPVFHIKDEHEEAEIDMLRQAILFKASEQVKEERQLFEYGKPLFTYIFIAIQLIMFGLLEAYGGSTNTETLVKFGAKYNPLIINGEWWRFFTPIFLHIGIFHLFMNTLALFYLGTAVEKIFGHTRFLWIYLFSGFAGSAASFLFSGSLSAGASGAIFGCFGALLYFGVSYPTLFFRTMGKNVIIVIVMNLIFGFTIPGIDNAGHIGGLIGGFLATGSVHFPKKRKMGNQAIYFMAAMIAVSFLLYFGYHSDRPDVVNNLAQEQINKGEIEEVHSKLSKYVEAGQGNATTFFLLSYSEIQLQDYDSAKVHLQEAIRLHPSFHEAHFNLALIYFEEGSIEKAKEHIQKSENLSDQADYQEFLRQLEEY